VKKRGSSSFPPGKTIVEPRERRHRQHIIHLKEISTLRCCLTRETERSTKKLVQLDKGWAMAVSPGRQGMEGSRKSPCRGEKARESHQDPLLGKEVGRDAGGGGHGV